MRIGIVIRNHCMYIRVGVLIRNYYYYTRLMSYIVFGNHINIGLYNGT